MLVLSAKPKQAAAAIIEQEAEKSHGYGAA
jgi:hypothetical protein